MLRHLRLRRPTFGGTIRRCFSSDSKESTEVSYSEDQVKEHLLDNVFKKAYEHFLSIELSKLEDDHVDAADSKVLGVSLKEGLQEVAFNRVLGRRIGNFGDSQFDSDEYVAGLSESSFHPYSSVPELRNDLWNSGFVHDRNDFGRTLSETEKERRVQYVRNRWNAREILLFHEKWRRWRTPLLLQHGGGQVAAAQMRTVSRLVRMHERKLNLNMRTWRETVNLPIHHVGADPCRPRGRHVSILEYVQDLDSEMVQAGQQEQEL